MPPKNFVKPVIKDFLAKRIRIGKFVFGLDLGKHYKMHPYVLLPPFGVSHLSSP